MSTHTVETCVIGVLSHARSSAVSVPSHAVYDNKASVLFPHVCLQSQSPVQDLRKFHVVYPISTDVIKPALRLRRARGHPGTRTYVHIYI